MQTTTLPQYPDYIIYQDGRVYSNRRSGKRFLKPRVKDKRKKKWYYTVRLYTAVGVWKEEYIHRLVALAFVPNGDNKPYVDHINRNTTDNSFTNLRWVTHGENMTNRAPCKKTTIPHRHIYIEAYPSGKKCYRILINRNRKSVYRKRFLTEKFTLEQVVKHRDEIYSTLNIVRDD